MPSFGRGMLEHWALDPACTYLNHGTVGAPPRRVLARQQALRDEIERQPSRFMLRELAAQMPAPWRTRSRLREAADRVATFVGVHADDLVFVPNVTTGLNAVLQSLPLAAGDEILVTDRAYGAVRLAAGFAARQRGASLSVVELPDPIRSPDDVVEAIDSAMTPRTKLVVVDHVTADTALVMPVAKIAAACQRRRVPVLVDGAHAPGSIALDIAALGVDWYAANLHKWAHAPRACGLLWAAAGRQAVLHAPVISWGHRVGFREEFELNGTGDPTAYLAAPEGLAMLQEWGFERVVAYMHGLAWDAARLLTARWGTAVPAPREMVGAMVSVPLPEAAGTSSEDAARLRLALLMDDAIEVHMHAWRGRVWTRVSAQIYNELPDVERLASAIERRLAGKSPAS
jgi:isopenicillin-N epimerase